MEDSYHELFGFALYVPWYAKQLMLAAIVGLCIGVERELRGKPASLRTFSIISTGSCLFTILSIQAAGSSIDGSPYDVTRIAAQIVTGIGFLGGGVIFKTTDRIEGITTGALIWLAAALGMACGFNQTGPFFWTCVVGIQVHLVIYVLYELIYFTRERKENGAKANNT